MSSKTNFIGVEPTGIVEDTFTPTAGQTVWNLNYTVGRIFVFLNGIKLINGVDFTADNGTSVTLTVAAETSDVIEFTCMDVWKHQS